MNDNPREPMPERLAREKNIATNGRLGVAGAFVLAIYAGNLRAAFVLVLVLFLAWLAEQLPGRWRQVATLAMLGLVGAAIVTLAVWL